MRRLSIFAVLLVVALAGAFSVSAGHYTLFGNASVVSGGNPGNAAEIVSDATAPGYGGVSVAPASPLAWADLDTLSLDYNVTDDDCGVGSPRVSLGVDTTGDGVRDGVVFVYLGPGPSFTGCAAGWVLTGNMVTSADLRWDSTQFGGPFYGTYATVPASVAAGNIVTVSVVADTGYTQTDGEQTILVDNINLDGHITTFDPNRPANKDACKNGGWASLERADFTPFKNQGDCIQYVNTGK